jgi:hypothetical protein
MSEELGKGCEAPTLFRRGAIYYAIFDHTCCFCAEGSGARVLMATHPLGPYHEAGNMNRDKSGNPIIPAQQTSIARLDTPDGPAYIWMGDLWKKPNSEGRGHDLQYWSAPLKFNADGSIVALERTTHWTARIRSGSNSVERSKPYTWPQKDVPATIRKDACYGTPLNERGEPEGF